MPPGPSISSLEPPVPSARRLEALIRYLPKAELHVHLEGTITANERLAFASINRLNLPAEAFGTYSSDMLDPTKPLAVAGLDAFLTLLEASRQVLVTRDDFRLATLTLLDKLGRGGVVYAEISFDPQAHTTPPCSAI